jgi:glucose-1-phosphatase
MTVRAVLWDVGGVLLRTEDPLPRRRWEERLGLPAGRLADVVFGCPAAERATIGEALEEQVWREAAEILCVPVAELDQFKSDFFAGDRWDISLLDFIRGLHPKYRMGILSNAWLGARRNFSLSIPQDLFNVFLISAEERMRKPEERFFRLALRQLDTLPEETIFIDDFKENIASARQIGFQSIQFQNAESTIAEVRRLLSHP